MALGVDWDRSGRAGSVLQKRKYSSLSLFIGILAQLCGKSTPRHEWEACVHAFLSSQRVSEGTLDHCVGDRNVWDKEKAGESNSDQSLWVGWVGESSGGFLLHIHG
jgi:hypothetical protein